MLLFLATMINYRSQGESAISEAKAEELTHVYEMVESGMFDTKGA